MSNAQPQPLATGRLTRQILLIDDSQADALLMQRALRKFDLPINFSWVQDAVMGLKTLSSDAFDHSTVIFLDIKMPKLSGLDILAQLDDRGKLRRLTNINIMSSSSLSGDIETALKYPNVTYYTKPDGYASLRELLTYVLN